MTTKRLVYLTAWIISVLTARTVHAAITIDANISRDQGTASATVTTSAFSTTSSNELLLAFIATDYKSGANTTVTGVSGAGLTWVLVKRTNAQSGTSEIWRAFAPSPLSSVSVAATLSQSVAASLTVMSFSGVDTSGTNGSGAIGATASGSSNRGAPSASLTTTRNGSWVVGVGNDFDSATARTAGANQTVVHQYLVPVGDTYWVQRQNSPTALSGTAVTINDTAPAGNRYNLTICEVLAATSGAQTWSISGTITPVSAGSGATLTLTGAAAATVTADTSGNYSFTGLANGTYTVTPAKSGFTFSPPNQSVPVNGANVTGVNFAAQTTWSISGTISPTSAGSGATVTLTGASTATVTADTSGNYSFTGLANGTYTVTPAKSGFTFSPPNQIVPVNGANVTGVNFAAQTTWSISGTISPTSAGSGASVTLSGAATATVTADTSGNYSFTGLANGTYTVTPAKSGFTFSPANQSVPVNGANVTGVNFAAQTATWSISGTISPVSAGSGASVTLTGAATATVTADTSGNYSFTGLANGTYTVTPAKSGFTFSPPNQTVPVNGANVTGVNFAAQTTWSISGTISPTSAGSGATVMLTGAATATVTADTSGNYSFTGLGNGTYTVTPARSGFTFSPANQSVPVNGANVTGVNFASQTATWSISGTISPTSTGSGATVMLTGAATATVTADTSGNYSFTGLANGTYTVKPTKSGIVFSPLSQSVPVNGANVIGVNFSGQTGGITFLQSSVNGNESTGANISTAFHANNTAGNFLIVTGTAARPATTISISDTAGNTYVPAMGPVTDATQDVTAYIWYVPNCKAGPNSITLTPSTPAALEIHISEWTGIAATSPVDQTSSARGSGTSASSGSAATTMDGELIFGYTFLFNTASAGAGFTGLSLVNGDLDEYQVQPTAGNVAATFTQATGTWFALMATFRPAGGPPPPTWTVSGTITPSSANASVSLTGPASASVAADGSGNYAFTNLANGTYTVTPSASGYAFTPGSQTVTVNGANVTGVNFTGQTSTSTALAVDATVFKDNATSSATIATTPFSTTSGSELLLAFIATDYRSGANTTVNSVSGAGLTWVLVQRTNVQGGTAEIWRAFSAAPLSNVTVTATLSQSVAASLTVMTFIGADPSGTNGSGAIGVTGSGNSTRGAPTASLTTTRSGSWVVGVGNDFDNALSRTPGSSQRMVHQYLASIGDTYWVQMQNTPTPSSGTTVTINDTSPTTDRYNLSICEVLAASGTGTNPTPPTVSVTAPAASATVASLSTLWAQASDTIGVAGVQFLLNGSSLGAEVTTAPYTITWNSTTVANGSYTLAARARNTSGLTTTSAPVTVTVDNSGSPAVVGSWSSVINLPTVAVDLILLKNNKLLLYEDGASPTVWDYVNGTFTGVPTSADLFCSGHAVLADGRVLIVGGYGGGSNSIGIANAEIFDPSNNSWTAVPNMAYRRWYPTATTLSDGRVLVTAGWQTSNHTNAGIPEIYDPSTNKWTQLTSANNPFETYPFIYQLSDGRIIHVNGSEYATVTDVMDLGTQTWSVVDPNIVDGGSSSMYLPDKIMKAGSATDSQAVGPSSNTTFVLDTTQPSPTWKQKPSMAYARSFLNLTTLPDGTVLATGGETDRDGGNIANAVYAAELWSPQTQTWTTMASMHTPREYHGTALLLPDGRVLVSGMGADFGNVPDEKNAEFYSPPYLFKGARPIITQSPAQIQNGTSFFVGTPDGASVSSVVLIRTGAVTHFFDQNTRFVPLSFQQTAGGLTVTAPASATLAPPGYYMLFLVNSNGVPSIAPFVQVQ